MKSEKSDNIYLTKDDFGMNISGKEIADLMPNIIAVVDSQKKYIWLNKSGLEFFGKDAIGKEASAFFIGEQEVYKQVEPLFHGDENMLYLENWQKRQDGQNRLLAWWCRNLKSAQSDMYGALSTAQDITDIFEMTQKLKIREKQMDSAMRLAHLGSWEYETLADKFIFNDSFYTLFGTDAEREGGYTMSSAEYAKRFLHPDDLALVGLEVKKSIETKDPQFTSCLEHRIRYKNGDTGHIRVSFFIVKNEKGQTIKSFGINQDITESKQREISFKEMSDSLQAKIYELEKFNKLVANREFKMIELKKRIHELKKNKE